MTEWPYVPIEEASLRVAMGPFGSSIKVSTFVSSGIPVISGQHLRGSRLYDFDYNFVTEAHADQLAKANVQRGDVILTHAGNIGQVAYIPNSSQYERYVISQRQFYIRCDPLKLLPEFLVYYFESHEGRHRLLANANQTGVPSLSQPVTYIRKVEIPLPSLVEQRAISDVLGALDDKIESNRRMAKTAADLCDQMFLATSDVDCQISEAGQVTMGSSPPGDTYNTDGVGMPFYQGVTDFGLLSPTRRVWTTSPIREAKVGATLVSVRAPVGRLNEAIEHCCIGRGVAAISSSYQTTLYYALRQADAVWAPFEGEGTVFGSINKGDLEGARIAWISPDRIAVFENKIMDIHQCVRASIREIHSLTSLRDALLPEMLSGRLRVKDAESMMENV